MLHQTIIVVDVASFTDPARTMMHQRAVRQGLYNVLRGAFVEAGVDLASCVMEDRGDGALILVPPGVAKSQLADQLPDRLVAGLCQHNAVHAAEAEIQLRVGLHAGEVSQDRHGAVSQAVNLAFRILQAPEAKSALKVSTGVLALISSDSFYQEVIRHNPAADPDSYRQITVTGKDTSTAGWLRLPDSVLGSSLPASIYLEDGKESSIQAALTALRTVAEEAGSKLIETSVPIHGSFWQRFRAKISDPDTQEALNRRLIKLERSAEVRLLAVLNRPGFGGDSNL